MAITFKPDCAEIFNNRGSALMQLEQHEAAIASFDKALALKADSVFLDGARG